MFLFAINHKEIFNYLVVQQLVMYFHIHSQKLHRNNREVKGNGNILGARTENRAHVVLYDRTSSSNKFKI